MEETCSVALATAYNARETEGSASKQELTHFVEEVSYIEFLATPRCMILLVDAAFGKQK